jgi:hypothetical protein
MHGYMNVKFIIFIIPTQNRKNFGLVRTTQHYWYFKLAPAVHDLTYREWSNQILLVSHSNWDYTETNSVVLKMTVALMESLSHEKYASAYSLESAFPPHVYLPHFLQKCRPSDIQLLSNPCDFWKCFLIHNKLFLKQEFICEYCLSVLA